MHNKYGVNADPDCYPNTNVLKNLLNLTCEKDLEQAESEITSLRLEIFTPTFSNLSFNYLQDIHHFLFQDIYAWAGTIRSVDSRVY